MHNWMSHCYLLGIYTCHLTCRSVPRLAPTVDLRSGVLAIVAHIKVYGNRIVGVIKLGVVNNIPNAGQALNF
jgi:hypothetical protein